MVLYDIDVIIFFNDFNNKKKIQGMFALSMHILNENMLNLLT